MGGQEGLWRHNSGAYVEHLEEAKAIYIYMQSGALWLS